MRCGSVLLIRHGETPANAARVFQTPETPLSAMGREQAARLAARLAEVGLVRIVSSDYRRAFETAEAVALRARLEVETEPLLRERDFGDLRGQPYAALGGDPFDPDVVPPNGESHADFIGRVERAWARVCALAAQARGPLAVVSHGQFCRALVQRHTRLGPGMALPQHWRNTSVTEIQPEAPWELRRVNCIAHLD